MNRKISLDTGWKLRYEELHVEKLEPMILKTMDDRWMDVNLPCDVHMPLIEKGIIPEPTIGVGYQESAWIEEKSWWFYRELIIDQDILLKNDRLYIVLEQLDTNAQIWINDQLVGEQKSVHYPFKKDIKFDLKAGINTILVRVTTGFEGIDDNRIQSLEGIVLPNGGREDARRAFLRKPQFTCGWDWAPRLLTCGMNGNAFLVVEQSVVVRDVHVVTTQIEPSAELNINIHIDNLNLIATQDVMMKVSVLYDNQEVYIQESDHNIRAGSNYFTNVVTIETPLLWWPNGYGDQPLYELKVEVIGEHSCDCKAGIWSCVRNKAGKIMLKGLIFDIKEFAVYDGPGIRTTVFFKGCPLSCKWCHNPEGLVMKPELMVTKEGCIHCGACYSPCNHPECKGLGRCTKACTKGLVKVAGQWMGPDELEMAVRKNEVVMKQYGGVTFSGGEPLLQHEFLEEMLNRLYDFHLTIETSGYAQPEIFQRIIGKLNLVYMDIKHVDPIKHKEATGVGNELILSNLSWLKEQEIPFIIRVPLIPGINDDKEHLAQIAPLLKGAKHLERVEFLPYNTFAGFKYSKIQKPFMYNGFSGKQVIDIPKDVFMDCGIPVREM